MLRVYSLAEELGVSSKELMQKAEELKIKFKQGTLSEVNDKIAEKIRKAFAPAPPPEPPKPEKKTKSTKAKKAGKETETAAKHKKGKKKEAEAGTEPAKVATETTELPKPAGAVVEPPKVEAAQSPVAAPPKPAPHKPKFEIISSSKMVAQPIQPLIISRGAPKKSETPQEVKDATPIIATLSNEAILADKGIRALRSNELNFYNKDTVDRTKGLHGKLGDRPTAGYKPMMKKTFFFKRKYSGSQPMVTPKPVERKITISGRITLKELCEKIGIKANIIMKKLMEHSIMIGINDYLSEDALILIALEFKYEINVEKTKDIASQLSHITADKPEDLKPRPPVITFMGHVDHGKTSLIDKIRSTKVADNEAGYITQHLGSYEVMINNRRIVILDTPGHEAFAQMRSRGANVTDIVILVVAADDGVMPQTEEAISHARAANLPIIVAINKIDKPGANLMKVKQQLGSLDLVSEEWSGKTIMCEVSAITGAGIDHLLEMILLQSEMMELKANPDRRAYGTVLEARLTETQGPLMTVIVQNGTLNIGDIISCGGTSGRIRSMANTLGRTMDKAGPTTVIKVSGLSELPMAGDKFYVMTDVQTAVQLAEAYKERHKEAVIAAEHTTLENLFDKLASNQVKEIRVILKADVTGSLEVISQLLSNFTHMGIKSKVIHRGVGQINESDVLLADVSDAIIVGFNTVVEDRAKNLASERGIEIKVYRIIYEIIENMKLALEGLLEPEIKEVITGKMTIRDIFKISRLGNIAGCYVNEGTIERSASVRVYREKKLLFTGKITSLKRFKDDVKEVNTGFECGIQLDGFNDLVAGDIIEGFRIEKTLRKSTAKS